MAASIDLTTLTKLKAHLGVTGTDDDTLLKTLIDQASELVEQHCGREFAKKSRTEYHDGKGLSSLILKVRPIESITSIHDDLDRDFETADLVDADDYTFYPDSGIVTYEEGKFQDGNRNVQVIYVAGYEDVPSDLELSCNMVAATIYNWAKQGREGIASENLGGASVTYEKELLSPPVVAMLAKYRDVAI